MKRKSVLGVALGACVRCHACPELRDTAWRVIDRAVAEHGSMRRAARALGVSDRALAAWMRERLLLEDTTS